MASPEPDATGDLEWLADGPWAEFGLILIVALIVLFASRMLAQRQARSRRERRSPDFDLRVAKFESLPVSSIENAKAGPTHLTGIVCEGQGSLGDLVYRNRFKGRRATAIAAELVLLRDDSGIVGLEKLEDARVIAPREEVGGHDVVSLLLDDRVEVVGELLRFDQPTAIGAGKVPLVGMLGTLGPIQIRVLERGNPPAGTEVPSVGPQPASEITDPTSETST